MRSMCNDVKSMVQVKLSHNQIGFQIISRKILEIFSKLNSGEKELDRLTRYQIEVVDLRL